MTTIQPLYSQLKEAVFPSFEDEQKVTLMLNDLRGFHIVRTYGEFYYISQMKQNQLINYTVKLIESEEKTLEALYSSELIITKLFSFIFVKNLLNKESRLKGASAQLANMILWNFFQFKLKQFHTAFENNPLITVPNLSQFVFRTENRKIIFCAVILKKNTSNQMLLFYQERQVKNLKNEHILSLFFQENLFIPFNNTPKFNSSNPSCELPFENEWVVEPKKSIRSETSLLENGQLPNKPSKRRWFDNEKQSFKKVCLDSETKKEVHEPPNVQQNALYLGHDESNDPFLPLFPETFSWI